MNLSEIIETLTEALNTHGDIDVKIAMQPNYPLWASVANVAVITDKDCQSCCEPHDLCDCDEPAEPTVFICATDATDYTATTLWEKQ